jgi:hypothetical protein
MAPSCGINRKHIGYRYNRSLSGILLIKCQFLTGFANYRLQQISNLRKRVVGQKV